LRLDYVLSDSKEVSVLPIPAQMEPLPTPTPVFQDVREALRLPEIRLQLPRNVPLRVGIIGSITTGGSSDFGTCQQFLPLPDSGTPPVPESVFPSFSLLGTREFPTGVSNETEIPLKVFVTKGQTEPRGFSTCSPELCPPFVKASTQSTLPLIIRIQHFLGGAPIFEHFFSLSTQQAAFIPESDAIRIDFLRSTQTTKLWFPCLEVSGNQKEIIPLKERSRSGGSISLTCQDITGFGVPLTLSFPGPSTGP
jgi:hypothetical protein